jgi:tetraacyldisaccharide 4'-kinase
MSLRDWLLTAWFAPQRLSLLGRILWAVFSVLAAPLSWITRWVSARKASHIRTTSRTAHRPPVVLVVGNLVVGGAGKTPIVIALVQTLQAAGFSTGVIARGYKASAQEDQTAAFSGDEARLIHQRTGAPVVTHQARRQALQRICQQHPELQVVISDDGLQHAALPRDIEFAVIDARGLGNRQLLPLGPLRESPVRLEQVDAIVFSNGATATTTGLASSTHVPQFTSQLEVLGFRRLGETEPIVSIEDFAATMRNQTLCALAGIASPSNFFSTIETLLTPLGITLPERTCLALPDHAPISDELLTQHASQHRATVILMTEKDLVKCHASWRQAHACWALVIRAQLPHDLTEFTINRVHQLLGHLHNGPAPA